MAGGHVGPGVTRDGPDDRDVVVAPGQVAGLPCWGRSKVQDVRTHLAQIGHDPVAVFRLETDVVGVGREGLLVAAAAAVDGAVRPGTQWVTFQLDALLRE